MNSDAAARLYLDGEFAQEIRKTGGEIQLDVNEDDSPTITIIPLEDESGAKPHRLERVVILPRR
jgi:hypothetical protein